MVLSLAIVIPTYNRKSLLLETVEDLLKQGTRGLNLHIIVVDDGSTDGTQGMLSEQISDARVHYIRQANRERGAARNLGAKFAMEKFAVDWLLFFDSDDVLLDGSLEAYGELARGATDEVVAIYSQIEPWSGGEKREAGRLNKNLPEGDIGKQLMRDSILPLGGTLIRSKAFSKVGGFSEDRAMTGSEDFHFLLRVALSGRVLHLRRKTVLYRQHFNNTHPKHYLVSTELAAGGLEAPIRAKWPGQEGLRAFGDLRHLCALSKVGALNQTGFSLEASRALVQEVCRRPRSLFTVRVWRLALSVLKRSALKTAKRPSLAHPQS